MSDLSEKVYETVLSTKTGSVKISSRAIDALANIDFSNTRPVKTEITPDVTYRFSGQALDALEKIAPKISENLTKQPQNGR